MMVSAMNPGVQSQLAEGMRDEGLIRYVSFGGGGRGMGEGGMYGGDDGEVVAVLVVLRGGRRRPRHLPPPPSLRGPPSQKWI